MRIPAEEQANLLITQMCFEKAIVMNSGMKDERLLKLLNGIYRAKISMDFFLTEFAYSMTDENLSYFRDIKREITKIESKVMKERADEASKTTKYSAHDDMAK